MLSEGLYYISNFCTVYKIQNWEGRLENQLDLLIQIYLIQDFHKLLYILAYQHLSQVLIQLLHFSQSNHQNVSIHQFNHISLQDNSHFCQKISYFPHQFQIGHQVNHKMNCYSFLSLVNCFLFQYIHLNFKRLQLSNQY